jgi:hypothetical protein
VCVYVCVCVCVCAHARAYPSGISVTMLVLWTLGHYAIHLQHLHLILHPEQE